MMTETRKTKHENVVSNRPTDQSFFKEKSKFAQLPSHTSNGSTRSLHDVEVDALPLQASLDV